MYRCSCGIMYASQYAMQQRVCCGTYGRSGGGNYANPALQMLGAVEVAEGIADGDIGEVVAGKMLMSGSDPLSAVITEEVIDFFE